MSDSANHCNCGCIYTETACPNCNYVKPYRLEYGVEYCTYAEEGEQWHELSEFEFLELIAAHKARGLDPLLEYDRFTIFDNGREGRRLTIRDEYGVYYG
jgi:hypothetical protein